MILANTGVVVGSRALFLPFAARLIARASTKSLCSRTRRQLDDMLQRSSEAAAWNELFAEMFNSDEDGRRLRSQYRVFADFVARDQVASVETHMATLIVSSADDEAFPPFSLARLQRRFLRAHLAMLSSAGHISFATQTAAFLDAVTHFLAR